MVVMVELVVVTLYLSPRAFSFMPGLEPLEGSSL